MNKQLKIGLAALVAGLLVAVVPAWLTGPSADLTGSLQLGAGLWAAIPILFLAGVLTSLTPCVYPLIPITVSIFGARSQTSNRARAAALSSTYVLGIATMYSVLGVAAAASGKAFGSFMGNPWVVGVFAAAMLVFAASMFGLFEIQLPSSLQTKLVSVGGVGFGSAFGMGLVAGIVAAPCTGPVLGAVLTFVASTRNLWFGFWLLFSYAMGMGLLFFVLGTFSVSLPKSGAWMDAVKTVLGVALVVVAISFVRPLLPRSPEMAFDSFWLALIAGVVVAVAVLIGTVQKSFHDAAAVKTVGLVMVVVALSFRFGWIVEPKVADVHVTDADGNVSKLGKVDWMYDETKALARAKAENKYLIIDFYADWCTACVELDKHTFSDPTVRQVLAEKFVMLKVDGTDDTDEVIALQDKYGLVGMPLLAFVSPNGEQLLDPKVLGFLPPDKFLAELAKLDALSRQ